MILKDQHQSDKQHKQKTFDELIEGLSNAKYPYLQLFLRRDGDVSQGLGQRYLMVTPSSFGVVTLINLDFDGSKILLDLQDCTTEMVKKISIDINDNTFNFLLIAWRDIRKMVIEDLNTKVSDDKLLEFEF